MQHLNCAQLPLCKVDGNALLFDFISAMIIFGALHKITMHCNYENVL